MMGIKFTQIKKKTTHAFDEQMGNGEDRVRITASWKDGEKIERFGISGVRHGIHIPIKFISDVIRVLEEIRKES